jgi:signal transduction histidine kinase
MKPLDFFDIDEKELLKQKGEEAFTKGMADVEAHFFTKDKKKIPYYFTAWRIIFEGNPCLIGVGIDITEKVEAEELLIKSNEDIRRLASHLTQVREEERKRIGREIHDELGQQLTAMKMDVAWIDKKTPDETNPIKNKLKNIITLLDGSNQSVRRILTELSPGIIDNHGLLEGLERLNRQFAATTGIFIDFTTAEAKINLSQEIANCIFRVYQESLTNVMRYAKATKVITSLNIINNTVIITIKDDGKGFDTAAVQNKKSFGILGMKERVLSQSGKFEILSKIGKGTKIIVTVPYKT